jgi:hypothetical protein
MLAEGLPELTTMSVEELKQSLEELGVSPIASDPNSVNIGEKFDESSSEEKQLDLPHASLFRDAQRNRTLIHPALPQPQNHDRTGEHDIVSEIAETEIQRSRSKHTFVVAADTQLGMTSGNKEWETELEYSRQAVEYINSLEPRPLFCTMCGDISDMEASFFEGKGFTKRECDQIQVQQFEDFQKVYAQLHPDIAMVCVCGNHECGNRPTGKSIQRFKNYFGDDYLAFWANGTYNIVLNTNIVSNYSAEAVQEMFDDQLRWLEERLKYAKANNAGNIFVFGHHPWFLYDEEEEDEDLHGLSPFPPEWGPREGGFPDSYFHIPIESRRAFMKLFKEYGVTASFSGHFHQNLVSQSSFGMDMIITSSLSMVFESTGKPQTNEVNSRGFRVVEVNADTTEKQGRGTFNHHFISLDEKEKLDH